MKSEIMVPKLSICMATYNRGKFIGLTLDSIMSQMRSDVELIVVDGASPDDFVRLGPPVQREGATGFA